MSNSQPWSVTWRKAVVSAPRLVPNVVLRFTSPLGPQPLVINLPSRSTHKIPVYIFIPPSPKSRFSDVSNPPLSPKLTPVIVDFHGGGFVLGSCQEQAPFCSKLCRELSCVAISVDYRLGPYAQHPAALEDAEDVLRAVLDPKEAGYAALRSAINDHLVDQGRDEIELDVTKVGVSGFSSGGNLALNLVLSVNKQDSCSFPATYKNKIPVLMYFAAIDLRKLPSEREIISGFHEVPKSFFASLQLEQHLMRTYLPASQVTEPRASPALADPKGLHAQARFLLLLAEKDSLSKQNEDWAGVMADVGRAGHVVVQKFMGVVHGWTQFPDSWLDAGGLASKFEAHDKAVEFVRSCWEGEQ